MAASCRKDVTSFAVAVHSLYGLSKRSYDTTCRCIKVAYCTTPLATTIEKHRTTIDENVEGQLKTTRHRYHPGVFKTKRVQLPVRLQESISVFLKKYPVNELQSQAKFLFNYLASRKRAIEDTELRKKAVQMENELTTTNNNENTLPERSKEVKKRNTLVMRMLRRNLYHWQPIIYDEVVSVAYMLARIAPNYAALYRVFNEIQKREPEFQPEALLDFGSGVGTSVWAAEAIWDNTMKEYLCIDLSKSMHGVADALLRDGDHQRERFIKIVHQRHFIPVSAQNKYNITLAAFSLLDAPSKLDRLNTIASLWKKTEDFLVVIENGSREGFETVNEARDFVLGSDSISSRQRTEVDEGHVFAPCQHDTSCPRMSSSRGTVPCNCVQPYHPLKLTKSQPDIKNEQFSYIILRKGPRMNRADNHWPRIIEPVLLRSKHVVCNMCCSNGQLERATITASKHGKSLYRCVRNSNWGDLLPINKTEGWECSESNEKPADSD